VPRLTRGSLGIAAAALICIQIDSAAACMYDGASAVSVKYLRAIEVTAALRDRSNAQILDSRLVAPPLANMLGYHRAVRRVQRLRDSLERAVHEERLTGPGFSLVLVESGLWTRYAPDAEGVSIAVHTAGPQPADALVFTGEAVIEAIASGRLAPNEALRRGLIVVEGTTAASRDVSVLLRAAFARLADDL
jgi:hypothetical protein